MFRFGFSERACGHSQNKHRDRKIYAANKRRTKRVQSIMALRKLHADGAVLTGTIMICVSYNKTRWAKNDKAEYYKDYPWDNSFFAVCHCIHLICSQISAKLKMIIIISFILYSQVRNVSISWLLFLHIKQKDNNSRYI